MPLGLFRSGDRPLLHLGLLVATLVTTTTTFGWMFGGGLEDALAFSFPLVFILGAHEMGHYLLARIHQVDTSLPYFIPAPFLGVGTLGAVIRIRSRIPTRNALVDIGAAGPLAGLAIAIPVLIYGVTQSTVSQSPVGPTAPIFAGPNSLWVLLPQLAQYLIELVSGTQLAAQAPVRAMYVFGDNLLILALQHLVKGPLPEGSELMAHPMVIAGWFGLLVTMLNLAPIGQLDGGHLCFAIFGARARTMGKIAALAMLFLTVFYSAGWMLWLILSTKLIGFGHPEVSYPDEPLSPGRRLICAVSFIALALCVMPIPLRLVTV